mmetsp:Transcript_34082/g.64208  ORF Transcript_34082/g.64208 Transcript_34082/m.64208 type:complete len:208 (+) Transcript_34082:260-883(+)|eukprot:CAMPEP_0114324264 /NCGR_PEP_ID=MMETSP0059-20121206/28405_1 /TAXON_ID=36894 /ORGANISM="Pyramimonas parkeae, Strain CCMP726" /LENGTH=207 /DNA_ID=CAMNT_0001452773 /DNA_START=185 /DNA_END=808 /DNA_ORIENTATION=-
MFVISTLSDSHVRVLPENLAKPRVEALKDALEAIYVDTVFPSLGLCISLYEILSVEGGTVYQLDGAATFSVEFSLVMFRPFVGEILTGKLIKCNKQGLRLSLGFFDDILVPEHALQEPSVFDSKENLWVWTVDDNEAFMDLGEEVRFRVSALQFPEEPSQSSLVEAPPEGAPAETEARIGSAGNPFAPMLIEGDINADGLGCVSWWQ